ncbi:hypothetical protein [Wolbachia endosymbiont (group B) of Limnophora tigrina]|uniref:hypothetical protein n=1 Tax=Wolbachia endosymbiont (group B) of Limnophora tigrina TaxID=3139317 RepID=UPI0035B55797
MKETFSSEKEKITCKGAMEVVDTQLYERCNIAQCYTVNDVIPVSGHTTVRTSRKTIGLVLTINYWCHSSNSLPVIPVRDTGIQPLITNKQVYRFDSHKNSRFHAKNNVHYEKTGFQCRSTGMTPILYSKLQRSYNCVSGHWDDTFVFEVNSKC